MDRRAAEEYHAALLKKLHRKSSTVDRLIWIPILGLSGYFAFGSVSGSIFGGSLGWGICAILSNLDALSRETWHEEFLRHLHEHTDEAEAGKALFTREENLDKILRRWWEF